MKKIIALLTIIVIFSACSTGGKIKKTPPQNKPSTKITNKKPLVPKTRPQKTKPQIVVKEQKAPKPQTSQIMSISKKSFYRKRVIYKKSFYPFFVDKSHVPFGIKIKLEKSIWKIKRLLKRYSRARIVVKGYTSRQGKTRENLKLSLWRAQNTARYISWKGKIPLRKFRIYGKGELARSSKQARQVKVFIVR